VPRLLARFAQAEARAEIVKHVGRAVLEDTTRDAPPALLVSVSDAELLRGIPAVGASRVGGAIKGTRPVDVLHRLDRDDPC
jgi:hypothetical protein